MEQNNNNNNDNNNSNNEPKEPFKAYETIVKVQALPMTKGEGVKADVVLDCPEDEENTPGYLVRFADGYATWMEADEFEAQYKLVEE